MTDLVSHEGQAQPTTGEINLAALPRIEGLTIVSAELTPQDNGSWQVDLIVAGRPHLISRFREGLTRTKAVHLPIMGENCMVRFNFNERDSETPVTTATWVIIDSMEASVVPTRENLEPASASITPATMSNTPGRRRDAARRPRHRYTASR